uniref:Uncharacterized protein n=1 Tax=Plectus sambesii TaxID=2011161 RepID=A0A914W9I1_9BILA
MSSATESGGEGGGVRERGWLGNAFPTAVLARPTPTIGGDECQRDARSCLPGRSCGRAPSGPSADRRLIVSQFRAAIHAPRRASAHHTPIPFMSAHVHSSSRGIGANRNPIADSVGNSPLGHAKCQTSLLPFARSPFSTRPYRFVSSDYAGADGASTTIRPR